MPRLKIHALAVSAAILMNALPAVPLPARAAALRPATIEDVRSIQSFVHDSDDYYAQEPADLNAVCIPDALYSKGAGAVLGFSDIVNSMIHDTIPNKFFKTPCNLPQSML